MPIIRDIIHGAVMRGGDLATMCAAINLDPARLHDSALTADFETSCRAWEVAVKASRDSLLGLHLGESTSPSIMGLIGHLMQTSPTLEKAFEQVCRYSTVATDMFRYDLVCEDQVVTLEYEPATLWKKSSPEGAEQAVDQAMAGTLHVFYLLAGKRILPDKARFMRRKLVDRREYERVFGASITTAAESNAMVFSRGQLATKVISYDKTLFSAFDRMLAQRKKEIKDGSSVARRVEEIVHSEFNGSVPSIGAIAACMSITTRTLQRRLRDEGEDFRSVSTRIRKEIAAVLLKGSNHKMKEVASILGYADSSSFRRALKSWK